MMATSARRLTALSVDDKNLILQDNIGGPISAYSIFNFINDELYNVYCIEWSTLTPSSGTVSLYARTSSDNGINYDSGSTDYQWTHRSYSAAAGGGTTGSNSDDHILISPATSASSTATTGGRLMLYNPSNTATYTELHYKSTSIGASNTLYMSYGVGVRNSAGAVNAIQLSFSANNINSGLIRIYGYHI